MKVLAFPAVRAAPSSEEEAAIFDAGCVGAGEALVPFDVAAGLGFCFAGRLLVLRLRWMGVDNVLGVVVFSVSSCPFVVPNVYVTFRK